MKKFYLFVLFSTLLSLSAYGNGVEINGIYYLLDATNLTATVTYPNETTPSWTGTTSSYTGVINIPEQVSYQGKTYTVNSIGNNAFIGSRLTSITLPNTIISIGSSAFCNHRGVTTLDLPHLQSIGNEAFRWCHTLQKVVIPESITTLGITIFQGCLYMTEIELPQNLASIPYACFNACSALTSITLPSHITSIPQECFNACVSLKSVSLPVGVTSVGLRAFKGTESIEKFFFPKNVTSLGDELFGGYAMEPYSGGAVPQYTGIHQLKYIFIDRETPPTCSGTEKDPFMRVNKNVVKLFVPVGCVEAYKAISSYADRFEGIYEFGSEASNVMDITDSTASITWFPDVRVAEYEIKLYHENVLLQQFLVNNEGQIISQQLFAPPVYRQKMDTTNSSTEYFTVSLEGLSAGSEYNYTIDGSDSQNMPVYHSEGSFITTNKQAIDHTAADDTCKQARKILRNGLLYIVKENKVYSLNGSAAADEKSK